MRNDLVAVIAAIRAHPWAIVPEYLEAIEALAARALDADVLERLRGDGHSESNAASWSALAAVGRPLEGAANATLRDGAAVIPILGAIFPRAGMISASADGTSLSTVMRDFRVAEASQDVERIVLLVDSPGGVVSGLGEAADAIRGAAKPVISYVTGMGASAAYWLASQAGEIVADRSGHVGSIGVVATISRQEQPGADGRRSYEVVSSGAPMKRPDVSTEEGRAAVQAEIDAMEAVFVADVAAGRRTTPDRVRTDFGRGGMLAAADALRAGMIDRIGTLDSVLTRTTGRTRPNSGGSRARAVALIETRRRAAGQE